MLRWGASRKDGLDCKATADKGLEVTPGDVGQQGRWPGVEGGWGVGWGVGARRTLKHRGDVLVKEVGGEIPVQPGVHVLRQLHLVECQKLLLP